MWLTKQLRYRKANHKAICSFGQQIADDLCDNHNGESFLPNDKLPCHVNTERVTEILTAANLEIDRSLIQFVMSDASCLFLILAFMSYNDTEWVSQLKALKDYHFTNRSLPVNFQRTYDTANQEMAWMWHRNRASSSDHSTSYEPFHIQGWSRNETLLFRIYQFQFTAPVFGDGQPFRFKFERDTVLPYLSVDKSVGSRGFFGEVYKVSIHAAHIRAPTFLKVTTQHVVREHRMLTLLSRTKTAQYHLH